MLSLPVPRRLQPATAYLFAVALVAISLFVRYPLEPALGNFTPFATFYWAVFISAWAGGFWPGVIATLFSAAVAEQFLIAPLQTLRVANTRDILGMLMFVLTGALMSFLCEALRTVTESSMRSAAVAEASTRDAQKARDRERGILESIADGFIAFDPQWRIAFVNAPAAQMLARDKRDLIGHHVVALHPNTIFGEFYPHLRKAVEERQPVHFEFQDKTSRRWFDSSAYPSASGVSLFMRDITESRELAEAARESEERFRILADSAPLMIWTSMASGRRDYVNRPFLQFSGRELDRELPDGWMDLVHADDRERVTRSYRDAHANQSGLVIEYRMKRWDGEYRWVLDHGEPRRSTAGNYLGFVGSSLDITDRRRAEEGLRESEAQLRLCIGVSQIGTWHMDGDGKLGISPELARMLGIEDALERGIITRDLTSLLALVHPDDRENLQNVADSAPAKGEEYEAEFRMFRPDGALRWILLRGQFLPDALGHGEGVSGVAIDVTERKDFEERLRHAQKLESLGVLAGGIAHDFNNLLTAIMGSASIVLDHLPPDSAAWRMQRNVLEAGERAGQLTNQMLAYAGKGRFILEKIDVAKLISDNLFLMKASVHGADVEIRLDLGKNALVVEADPAQMQQVLMNLVINAAEAIPTDREGWIRISTEVRSLTADDGPDLAPGDYVVLQVEDSGIGMDEATISRIFEPFFTTKFTGRGLGLAAVQGIVRGQRGSIRVTSTPGLGTRFQIWLPQASAAKGCILLVDDEAMIRETVTAALEQSGYSVVEAEDGRRALQLFREAPEAFAAILLDLRMPVMSGEEALPLLRGIRPDVKVIVFSGHSEAEVAKRFARPNGHFFIQKPFSGAQLTAKVLAVTGG